MKRFLITMVSTIITANSFAQVASDIQSATLIHGKQTSVYYGMEAAAAAQDAAADGDTIILSAGEFDRIITSKSLAIYGSGYAVDEKTGAIPTSVEVRIQAKESYDEMGNQVYVYPVVRLEGLCGDITIDSDSHGAVIQNLIVRKCKGTYHLFTESENCLISQCVFTYFRLTTDSGRDKQTNLNIENSWLARLVGSERVDNTVLIDHCVVRSYDFTNVRLVAHYTNSIIYPELDYRSTSTKNIFVSSSGATEMIDENGNWSGISNTIVWADPEEDGNYDDTKTYAQRFPLKYVGTDGTQVGLYGGHAPFDRISPVPRILAADVDIRTAEDGKLGVNFKVEAQTKE